MSEPLESHLLRQVDHAHRFFWHRARWRAVSAYLPRNVPFELVDVGAGAGVLATFLARDHPLARYRFVEPMESLRSFLRDRHGASADAGDDPDYRSATFVTLLDVAEHQQDDRRFLRGLVARMRPGATLLLTVPAGDRFWSQWDLSLGHFRRYDRGSLLECTRDLPLQVHEVSYLFPELVPLAALRARKRKVGGAGGAAGGAVGDDGTVDELATFPELPPRVNDVLAVLSSSSVALRRHWPTGTSLFLAATVDAAAA